jgi:hypothetical protein
MTTLEKLKLSFEEINSLDCRDHETYESFLAVQLKASFRVYKELPRLIAALEWVENKKQTLDKVTPIGWDGYDNGQYAFAVELLQILNGETKEC